MKILVTGGSGFLGKAICRGLSDMAEVVSQAFCHAAPGERVCDLRDSTAVEQLVRAVQPDVVVNCAAYRDPDACEADPEETRRLNVSAVASLLSVLPESAMFVQISTDYVFAGTNPPYTEEAPRGAVNVYGQSKVEAEDLVLASKRRHLILRIPILIGPDADAGAKGLITQLVEAVRSGRAQEADHVSIRFPTSTEDVSRTLRWLLENDKDGIWHVSAGDGDTRYGWTCRLAAQLGLSHAHIRPGLQAPERPAPRPANSQLSTEKVRTAGAPVCASLLQTPWIPT